MKENNEYTMWIFAFMIMAFSIWYSIGTHNAATKAEETCEAKYTKENLWCRFYVDDDGVEKCRTLFPN